jgi:Fe2+ or Zn2+ uptake regulation protein
MNGDAETTPVRPDAERVIDDLEQLRAISDPLRLSLIDLMSTHPDRGWTAKELAESLATKQTKLYHHLAVLAHHGFIRVVETRLVSGIQERRYAVTARSFRVDRSLLGAGNEPTVTGVLDGLFEKARSEIAAGVRAGLIDMSWPDEERRRMSLSMSHARLSPKNVKKVLRQIERLASLDELEDPDGAEYGLILAFYPRVTQSTSENDR